MRQELISPATPIRRIVRWLPQVIPIGPDRPGRSRSVRQVDRARKACAARAGTPARASPDDAIPDVRIDGDMYLDETTGDVWRWSDDSRSWQTFKGIAA